MKQQYEQLTQPLIKSRIQEALKLLRDKDFSLGFAESCTGGLLSSWFTETPGVSDTFMGSVVSYANTVKQNILKVSEKDLEKFGAVSEVIASQMAEGALQSLGSNVSVAITGIAGPKGGSALKPVGTVFIALAGPKLEAREQVGPELTETQIRTEVHQHLFSGDRRQIQEQSCLKALEHLQDFLKKN